MENFKLQFVFAGTVVNNNRRFYRYYQLENNIILSGSANLYSKKMGNSIGNILEIESKDEEGSTIYTNSAKFIGTYTNKEDIDKWTAKDLAAKVELRSISDSKKINGNIINHIKELKRISQYLNRKDKKALVSHIINEII
ncbi:hypothetical protein KAR91_14315 [Candidatus Pacearchaeota archaeon]|nr:hypothetical protein [Candidatus Pacearchaeota archaeon]